MRDLIDKLTQIQEGVGLANRKPGEKFANPAGDVLTFHSLEFYPERDSYESSEQATEALSLVSAELGIDPSEIHWANSQGTNKAFGIARFIDANNKDYLVGRWFQKISPNRSDNRFKNDLPGEFKYQSRAAQKEASPYKPTDVLTELKNNTAESILKQVINKFGANSDEVVALKTYIASNSAKVDLPRGNINPDGFRDYFCEMIQPIALVMGKPIAGNADEAADIFLGAGGYGDCVISFQEGVSGGLYDSLLVNPLGKQIKLSTKGGNGAKASVVNLIKSVNDLKGKPQGNKLLNKYKEAIAVLDIIQKGGHTDGALNLGVLYGIIKSDEKNQVKALKNLGPQDDVMSVITSKNLQDLYKGRKARNMDVIIPIEHMLSAIAYKVANHVNDKTNFGEAASSILNHSALVQMYTTLTSTDDTLTISFNAKWPAESVTDVLLRADKTYMSTQGKGNFVFEVLKGGATGNETDIQDLETDIKPDTTPQIKEPGTRSDIKAAPTASSEPVDNKVFGRNRRNQV